MSVAAAGELPEAEFAALVEALACDAAGRDQLIAFLREDHPIYDQRGTSAIVRMRGWILHALTRAELSDDALLFVLEELDAGRDGYLVAAAARALRSYASPRAAFAPFVIRAIGNMRYQDDAVTFDAYGAYPTSSTATTAIGELLATLVWLGAHARGVMPQLEALRPAGNGISRKLLPDVDRALEAMRGSPAAVGSGAHDCCALPSGLGHVLRWPFGARANSQTVQSTVFEDHDGAQISYADFFRGQPSIVAFFYTRCDNPQKCSLTVSKLAHVQRQLAERGAADRVRTAAITYDPGFDLPPRLRAYGQSRRLRMDDGHRLLRAPDGLGPLRAYFSLGVNFIESLVNRHRIEVYVLDAAGRIAASFGRIHWNERDVVDRAVELLDEQPPADSQPVPVDDAPAVPGAGRTGAGRAASPIVGTLASLAVALFPKCPVCWAAYMSVLGIAGLERVPYLPWMQPLLVAAMSINLASVWWRGRFTGHMAGFYLASAGALAIAVSKTGPALEPLAMWGVALTVAGSVVSAARPSRQARITSRSDRGRWERPTLPAQYP